VTAAFAVALLLLGVLIGGAGMRAHLARAGALWRPGAALLSLAAFAGALILLVREAWLAAAALAAVGAWLAISARRGPTGRTRPAARPSDMSPAEAHAILGLEEGATPEQIRAAYRRLMASAHPDRGGSRGLAAQLNAARDTLVKRSRA
jgi:hypothetical protein